MTQTPTATPRTESAAQHTNGPWSLHECGTDVVTNCDRFDAHTVYFGAGGVLIGSVQAYKYHEGGNGGGYDRPTDFEVNKANARLIAAAPELLAACIDLLQHASVTEHMSARCVEQARSAVDKATGSASHG